MKKFYEKLISCNNSVAGADSRFGKGCAGKNGPSHNVEIPESIYKRELEDRQKELAEQRRKEGK